MIRDADGHPIALPLAKLPSVPLAADISDLQRYLRRAPDPLTAQALLRRYVDDNITANTRRSSLSAALDTAVREVPKWAHQVSVTRQIYNLPPYDIERRTRANGSAYTHIAFFDVEDPPPPYSSTA
ncbi:hypothetical protein CcaverHIS002_0311970 [Cutaneotrichosporon cavernicola]|nr:hypothetical protein CcaverHIS002_0311970 [Cutaneotrichosporon cavernicola]